MEKDEKYLSGLIKNKIKENPSLEYKNKEGLENNYKIARSISSMANSNGGTIIYGLICEGDQSPEKIDWIRGSGYEEKIHQVLKSVNPKVKIEVDLTPNPKDNEEFIIIVEVPKSDDAPHQHIVNKEVRKYWARYGSTTREMEHYEIEGLFFRRKSPKLEIELKRCPTKIPSYDIIIHNMGKILAEKIFIKLLVPSVFEINDQTWPKVSDGFTHKGATYSEYHYIGSEFIYPELPNLMGKLSYPREGYIESLDIGFLIVCKDMGIKRGNIIMGDEKTTEIIYSKKQVTPFPEWNIKEGFHSIYFL